MVLSLGQSSFCTITSQIIIISQIGTSLSSAYWHIPVTFVVKSCLLFPVFLFIILCTRIWETEYWTHLLAGKPPTFHHCLLHQDSIAPNFSSACTFRFSHPPSPGQHLSANLLSNKGAKRDPLILEAELGRGEETSAEAAGQLRGCPSLSQLRGQLELCLPNTTSQIRQILSRGIIYFWLRHAQGRLKWWVNRFLRTQF